MCSPISTAYQYFVNHGIDCKPTLFGLRGSVSFDFEWQTWLLIYHSKTDSWDYLSPSLYVPNLPFKTSYMYVIDFIMGREKH